MPFHPYRHVRHRSSSNRHEDQHGQAEPTSDLALRMPANDELPVQGHPLSEHLSQPFPFYHAVQPLAPFISQPWQPLDQTLTTAHSDRPPDIDFLQTEDPTYGSLSPSLSPTIPYPQDSLAVTLPMSSTSSHANGAGPVRPPQASLSSREGSNSTPSRRGRGGRSGRLEPAVRDSTTDARRRGNCLWCRMRKIKCKPEGNGCRACLAKGIDCYPLNVFKSEALELVKLFKDTTITQWLQQPQTTIGPWPTCLTLSFRQSRYHGVNNHAEQVRIMRDDLLGYHIGTYSEPPTVGSAHVSWESHVLRTLERVLNQATRDDEDACLALDHAMALNGSHHCLGLLCLLESVLNGLCRVEDDAHQDYERTAELIQYLIIKVMHRLDEALSKTTAELFRLMNAVSPQSAPDRDIRLLSCTAFVVQIVQRIADLPAATSYRSDILHYAMSTMHSSATTAIPILRNFADTVQPSLSIKAHAVPRLPYSADHAVPSIQAYQLKIEDDFVGRKYAHARHLISSHSSIPQQFLSMQDVLSPPIPTFSWEPIRNLLRLHNRQSQGLISFPLAPTSPNLQGAVNLSSFPAQAQPIQFEAVSPLNALSIPSPVDFRASYGVAETPGGFDDTDMQDLPSAFLDGPSLDGPLQHRINQSHRTRGRRRR